MTSVGETLRRERLKRHLELEQISKELKISARMIEAIEDERFERLPGGVFAKSFVRQYARMLGLDEEEIASQVQHLIESPFSVQVLTDAEPAGASLSPIHVPKVEPWENFGEKSFSWRSWMPAAAMVIVAMLVCSGIYGWWQRGRHVATAQEPPPPAVEVAHASSPQAKPAELPAEPAAVEQPATAPAAIATSQPTEVVKQVPNTPSNPNAAIRVALTAGEPVWISARADGKYLFSGVLTANETRTVEATDTVILRMGNAGGLNVTLNGKPVGALGAKGQARTVQFTPGGFQIVAAPKPSLPL